jgi:hypothetical protein
MDCPDVCLKAFWLQKLEWVLEDCQKRSCWKNSIGVSVPRLCGSDVYVCSENCWLSLTVVYWLLGCNKVPSWIEPTSTLHYIKLKLLACVCACVLTFPELTNQFARIWHGYALRPGRHFRKVKTPEKSSFFLVPVGLVSVARILSVIEEQSQDLSSLSRREDCKNKDQNPEKKTVLDSKPGEDDRKLSTIAERCQEQKYFL